MYNRYQGNSGRVERIAEEHSDSRSAVSPPRLPAAGERRPPSPLSGLSGELGRLLHRVSPAQLETEDYLLICILYLLYRESGDRDFLFAIGGLLLL